MLFSETDYVAPASELVSTFARLLPDYLPGRDTGPAAVTDLRSCWIKSTRATMETLAHQYRIQLRMDDAAEPEGHKQLKMLWMRGDGASLAAVSGWGNREDLEASFRRLELIKAPQKMIIYTCARWQEAVLDQLAGALLRYPHHLAGECYISLNLLGSESKVMAHTVHISRSGTLTLPEVLFKPVAGSPFSWGRAGNPAAAL